MIGHALAIAALATAGGEASDQREQRLQLLQSIESAVFYADDQFRCRGYSPISARRRVGRALGPDFQARLGRVTDDLITLYGRDVVEADTELVAIGYKLTPSYCAKAAKLTADAQASLARLETSLRTGS